MVDLTSGRLLPFLDSKAGVETIYLGKWVRDSGAIDINNEITDSLPIIFHEYQARDIQVSETLQHSDEGEIYQFSINVDLQKIDKATSKELNVLCDLLLIAIVQFENGNKKVYGFSSGLDVGLTETSGGGKSSFSGYNLTLKGEDEKIPYIRFNQINFAVPGPVFPNNENQGGNGFRIASSENQVMNINWGDGTFEEVNLVANNSWVITNDYHTFATTQVLYNISFTFEKPESVVLFETLNVNIGEVFTQTVTKLVNIQSIILKNTTGNFGVTTFPQDLSSLTKLKVLQVEKGELPKIDDSILALPLLEELSFRGSLNLNDSAGNFEATNFDRLNELQNSLKILNITGCNINNLPSTFVELSLLEILLIGENPFTTLSPNIPTQIKFISLTRTNSITSWTNFDRLVNLEQIEIGENNNLMTNIPANVELSECKKLKTYNQKGFAGSENSKRDSFIINVYNFIITYANVNPTDASIDQNKFRDMHFNVTGSVNDLTGTYQAPPGFALGSDNGNPTTPEERIYVLVENYGHTWVVKNNTYEQI